MAEVRGVWIANVGSSVLNSEDEIKVALDNLKAKNFNLVFPVVWHSSLTLFRSSVMKAHGFDEIHPSYQATGFDPLEVMITEAHAREIKVIPWFEFGFAASHASDGGEILMENPDWKGIDGGGRNLRSGELTWMNPFHPEVQEFMIDLIVDCAANYDVDGIQGDDRLPACPYDGGYDPVTVGRFGSTPPPVPVNPQDGNADWKEWTKWRADDLTEFLKRLHRDIEAVGSRRGRDVTLSLSPNPYPWCRIFFCQDTKEWVTQKLVDTVHPQFYRPTTARYQREVNNLIKHFSKERNMFSPGICFRHEDTGTTLTANTLQECVEINRSAGLSGQVFFPYEGLLNNVGGVNIGDALSASGGVFEYADTLPDIFA
ncbi:family 10 glycosylhydrolase [Acaryochloris sp. IP29b_bin.137]|uniref:glycoside hydrolase family 10 protein n=1 Tax=Acaryochloris sp. IP29b_bin.137 TaxID=2969217 RepID=UPI00260CC028|nr:family 10 glycosylhydrolase [Acaryochloris sp. IP29b_bin.137]